MIMQAKYVEIYRSDDNKDHNAKEHESLLVARPAVPVAVPEIPGLFETQQRRHILHGVRAAAAAEAAKQRHTPRFRS